MKIYKDRFGRLICISTTNYFRLCPSIYRYPFFSGRWLFWQLVVDMNKIDEVVS